ncbi:MAG TPA: DUF418 domain-containing protein, partial [Vicinamibacterales bacterium]
PSPPRMAAPAIGPSANRIQTLDVLRGLALLGMIVVHFHNHTLEIVTGINEILRTLVWRLVEEKSHGTFALLFGAGFAIQLRRADARGGPFAGRYLRRLAVLFLFGFVAHAGFGYNVLIGYAVWGVPLLVIRRWSTRALIVTAVISAVSLPLYWQGSQQYVRMTQGPERAAAILQARMAESAAVWNARNAAEDGNSYSRLLVARLHHMAWFYRQPFFFMPGATLALFIVGLLLIRHRFFEDPLAHRGVIIGLMIFGLVSWIADNWLLDVAPTPIQMAGMLLRNQWLTFTYVGAFLLVVAPRAAWMALLRPIGLAGRMALTNYLVQIAVIDILFSGYGLGVPDILSTVGLAAAALLFAALVAFSTVWLRRCRFGPAEWVWRSLTYGTVQPLRIAPPAPVTALQP